MNANNLIEEHRNNVRQLWQAFVRVRGSSELLGVTPPQEIATYFIDEQGQPCQGLDMTAGEFAQANTALASLAAAAESELSSLRKLL